MANEIVQGDNGIILSFIIKDGDEPINLTSASVQIVLTLRSSGKIKQGVITDALNGKCQVILNSDDILYDGVYTFQPTVTFPDGRQFTSGTLQKLTVVKKLGFIPTTNSGGSADIVSGNNGHILVNGNDVKVYDDSSVKSDVASLMTSKHTHSNLSQLNRLGIDDQNKLTIDGIEIQSGGSNVTSSLQNGHLLVDGNDIKVYDDSSINTALSNKANKVHTHTLTDITDVDVSIKSDGYALQYDAVSGKFISKALPAVAGGSGSVVTHSTTNGNVVIDGNEVKVYDDNSVISNIGNLSNLTTTNKNNLVSAVNELQSAIPTVIDSVTNGNISVNGSEVAVYDDTTIKNNIGTLSNLSTTAKNSLVSAMNEVRGNVPTSLSGLSDVDVTNKTNGYALQYDSSLGKFVSKILPTSAPTPTNAYLIELNRWGISNDGTNPNTTTSGINNAIVWAVQNGYNYIKLPAGLYMVPKGTSDGDKTATIQLQSNMTLDLTGCTIQKETNTFIKYYTIYGLDIINTTIFGGVVKGDRDTHDYSNNGEIYEGCIGIFVEGKNRNVTIIGTEVTSFPGYSISFNGYQFQEVLIQYPDIESGTYDINTGVTSTNANFVRTKNSYTIANYTNIAQIGSFMITGNGYNSFGMRTDGGGVNLSNSIFTLYFYNSSGIFLGTLQRRCFDPIPISQFPSGTTTFKISFRYDYTKIIPNTFYLGIDARQQAIGTRIANCKLHDSYALGIAMSNTALTTIENNEMYNIGYAMQKIGRNLYPFPMAIDIEDGYNSNQHIIIRNNIFRDNQSLHLSLTQVRNILVEGNKFQGTGGIVFQGTKGSNAVSRGNEYNLTYGSGQTATYVKFENDHFIGASLQFSYESTYEDCVFDDMAFVAQADTYGEFATGTNYTVGTAVLPSSGKKNGFYYVCTTQAGVVVNTEPNWGTTSGGTTTDATGNVWTAYPYNPTYDLVQFINCKFKLNQPELTAGWNMRRFNLLFDNCRFDVNSQRYFTDGSSTFDWASKNQIVIKDCDINTAYSNSTLGNLAGAKVHIQRTKFTGLNDGNYPPNVITSLSLLIEESSFESFNADVYGSKSGATLTIKNSRFKLDKSVRRFGNTNEGFYIRNFDTVIIDNNEITIPTTTVILRPFSIFGERYLKITNNLFNSANTNHNLELWGAYRDSAHTDPIPPLTTIMNNNILTKFLLKPDNSYYIQLLKSIGNGMYDLDSSIDGSTLSMSSAPTSGYYYLGQKLYNSNPVSGGYEGWVTTIAGMANNTAWNASTTYSANTLVYSGSYVYQALTGGRSITTSPTFPTSINTRVDDVVGTSIWLSSHLYSVGDKVLPALEASDPITAPALTLVPNANATISPVTHYVRYTWVTATGETKASSEALIQVTAGNNLSISVPTFPIGVTKANIYVSTVTNQERFQGSINTSGTSYTISTPVNIAIVPTVANLYPLTSSNGYWYECTTAGTSGLTAPIWSKTANGTMIDGSVTWTVRGIITWKNVDAKAVFNQYGLIQ